MTKRAATCILALLVVSLNLSAADLYVSKDTGKNTNAGTKAEPLKNIEKAVENAKPGDKIYVCEGNYYGIRDKGFISVKKPVGIYGGYSKDFSQRDVLKYRTLIMPPSSANGTSGSDALIMLAVDGPAGSQLILDGIIFDKGDSNAYHAMKGKPAGVDSGMLILPPGKGINGSAKDVITSKMPIIGGTIKNCEFIIQNCVFNNAPNYAIKFGAAGTLKILNNVFTANAMSACEVWGILNKADAIKIEFAYNTVLFTWPRTNSFEDMGYGFRVMTKADVNVHHNIIGLSSLSGIDRCRIDSPDAMEKGRKVIVNDNRFFMNKQADVTLPGSGKFECVWVKDFEDVERFDKADNNEELKNVQSLKSVLNKAYLDGFLSAAYTEKMDYDANSAQNEFRRAMGLNQAAKVSSDVSMFANKYPLNDALKLFGAVPGFGAQAIK